MHPASSPLVWLRWAGAGLGAALCIAELTQRSGLHGPPVLALILVAYLVNIAAFLRSTVSYPRYQPANRWLLVVQILTAMPMDSTLSIIAAFAIPVVLRRSQWRRWIASTIVLMMIKTAVGLALQYNANKNLIPADTSSWIIALTFAGGIGEILAWHLFAFFGSTLIVRVYEDRQRVALLNAELRGAQVLLAESSRLGERLRISRELHDSLGHHLTSLSLQLEIAEHLPDTELRPKLREVQFLSRLLLAEVREAVSQWRTETSPAFTDALATLSESLPGITLTVTIEPGMPPIPPALGHALFRCTQEALTNAVRHGSATSLQANLERRNESLIMQLTDNGAGCESPKPGNGLTGITTRIAEFDGTVAFQSRPGEGFLIEIQAPLPQEILAE